MTNKQDQPVTLRVSREIKPEIKKIHSTHIRVSERFPGPPLDEEGVKREHAYIQQFRVDRQQREPVCVFKSPGGMYTLASGHSTLRAATNLGGISLLCNVYNLLDESEAGYIKNLFEL